jgi:hypothetical protein
VFLPRADVLEKAAEDIGSFLSRRKQRLASVG